jgi:ubiquinone/menaquinone biosynthesis C-methylase UbiE
MIKLLLRFFFHLLYHSLAWAYDLVAFVVSLGRWNQWTHAVLPYIHGRRVLELGYGTGHLQRSLILQNFETYGLDESRQMAAITGRRLRAGRATQSGMRLVRARGAAIPFPSQSFDTVVATFPAPYIAQADTLAEIHRVLRPDGWLVILLAAAHTGRGPFERLQAWLFRVTGEGPVLEEDFTRRLIAPFQQAGFAARVEWLEGQRDRKMLIFAQKALA